MVARRDSLHTNYASNVAVMSIGKMDRQANDNELVQLLVRQNAFEPQIS